MIGLKKVRGAKPYYKNPQNNILSLSEYYQRANKIIWTYSRKNPYIISYDSDDMRGMIVEYMINGDLKYNPQKNMSLESYRYSNGVFGINSYINTINGLKNKTHNEHERFTLYEHKDSANSHEDLIDSKEEIEYLLECPFLTEKQRECLRLHYLEKTSISAISRDLGIKKQSIQQLLKRAVNNLREWQKTLEET